jgi:glucokinase
MARLLVADIGGTRARFALSQGETQLSARRDLAVAEHANFEAALDHYIEDVGGVRPEALAVAVAGPVANGRARLTNGDWLIDGETLRRDRGFTAVSVLNDFEAVALSLPLLGAGDVEAIGGGTPVAGAPRVVLGPGTGLGVAGLVSAPAGPLPVVGEGGHVTLAGQTEAEDQILAALRARFGHVSAERVLSGQGLENLYSVLAGQEEGRVPASDIARLAASGDAPAVRALAHFAAFLGTVSADLALTFGARGGVFLAGGVLPRLGSAFDRGLFRGRFEDKGRFSGYLAKVPTSLILREDAGLLGLTSRAAGQA